uniref:Uncharacterized protein n=1 Tax=viral metagenome TaxID=1070528 RepID=A0A6C0DTF3_9ZZZZ
METFFYISQKIMNPNMEPYIYTTDFVKRMDFMSDLRIFSTENKDESKDYFLQNFFYYYVIFDIRKNGKFVLLKSIIENIFCSDEFKEKIINLFCSIQKINNGFSRLAYIYKNKKAPIKISTDMFLNPIKKTDKNVICIFDSKNSCKYLFTINDLMQIIKKSLTNSPNFFSDPSECKNPYTNIPFNKSTLYNIYFFIRYKNYIMPELIQNFFMANFDLENFRKENLYIIREYAINDYVDNLEHSEAKDYIYTMIKTYYKKKINISDDFPKNKLYEIMKPYLHYYFIATYSLCFEKRHEYFHKLCYKIRRFFKFNPKFGRKFIKFEKCVPPGTIDNPFNKNVCKKKVIIFNDAHVNFYEKENDTFLTSHVKNEADYYDERDDDNDDIINNNEVDDDSSSNESSNETPILDDDGDDDGDDHDNETFPNFNLQSDVENEDDEQDEDLINRTQSVIDRIINASNQEDDEENDNDSVS